MMFGGISRRFNELQRISRGIQRVDKVFEGGGGGGRVLEGLQIRYRGP